MIWTAFLAPVHDTTSVTIIQVDNSTTHKPADWLSPLDAVHSAPSPSPETYTCITSVHVSTKCIANDAKTAARRSQNCITKKCVLWTAGICHITEILWKTASSCKISLKLDDQLLSYGQKTISKMSVVCHLEFLKIIWLSPSSKSASVYQISSKSDDSLLRYRHILRFALCRPSIILNFWNL